MLDTHIRAHKRGMGGILLLKGEEREGHEEEEEEEEEEDRMTIGAKLESRRGGGDYSSSECVSGSLEDSLDVST
jgi:hypothetical protein